MNVINQHKTTYTNIFYVTLLSVSLLSSSCSYKEDSAEFYIQKAQSNFELMYGSKMEYKFYMQKSYNIYKKCYLRNKKLPIIHLKAFAKASVGAENNEIVVDEIIKLYKKSIEEEKQGIYVEGIIDGKTKRKLDSALKYSLNAEKHDSKRKEYDLIVFESLKKAYSLNPKAFDKYSLIMLGRRYKRYEDNDEIKMKIFEEANHRESDLE